VTTGTDHFAVLQKDPAGVQHERLKRAFATFSNLTDADAIRLANGARGILMRHLHRDAAQAFQRALHDEGIASAIEDETRLPKLPEPRQLQRLEITPAAFVVYDMLQRTKPIPWADIALVAAGAVRHFAMTSARKEEKEVKFSVTSGIETKSVSRVVHKVESDSQLVVEIVVANAAGRYQIEAAGFPFKYLIDRPEMSVAQKFTWLVREICRHATQSKLNGGAQAVHDGQDKLPEYLNRQMLTDEMVWLLWQKQVS
jgi:hypothetical protein